MLDCLVTAETTAVVVEVPKYFWECVHEYFAVHQAVKVMNYSVKKAQTKPYSSNSSLYEMLD